MMAPPLVTLLLLLLAVVLCPPSIRIADGFSLPIPDIMAARYRRPSCSSWRDRKRSVRIREHSTQEIEVDTRGGQRVNGDITTADDGGDVDAEPPARLDSKDDPLLVSMRHLGFDTATIDRLTVELDKCGLLPTRSSDMLFAITRDFATRAPQHLATMLQTDFGLAPTDAHLIRAAISHSQQQQGVVPTSTPHKQQQELAPKNGKKQKLGAEIEPSSNDDVNDLQQHNLTAEESTRRVYKSVIVNDKAKQRRQSQRDPSSSSSSSYDYGLPRDITETYPQLQQELEQFYTFMTRESTTSQDPPIRPATADVYMRHARLFLGWYLKQQHRQQQQQKADGDHSVSLNDIFPTKEAESASAVLDFVVWLRSARGISVTYEANLLRGLTKLLKFRFAQESASDPSYGEKSYQDIPVVREIRRWHRDANKRQAVAPRSSNEDRKWLSWPEYLDVVQSAKDTVEDLMVECGNMDGVRKSAVAEKAMEVRCRKVAVAFQKYLILSIFSSCPDRQRTIRELEIGRTFLKNSKTDCWTIKHAPEDYKTGKHYGERPVLQLPKDLTPMIDDFLGRWRAYLKPVTENLFVQPRTGRPLTQDSVYQAVSRTCYQYSGKRTNPHLLRDMIVTHVRESSDASEKALEALALYMGHSLTMQRNSYDRRTLTKKVEPAVELLKTINSKERNSDE